MALTVPNPGSDFALVVDNLTTVSLAQIDPDSGATLQTSSSVICLQPMESINSVTIGEGEVGATTSQFTIQASSVAFVPEERDQLTDATSAVWVLDTVQAIAFDTLYQCTGVLMRGNVSPPPPPPPPGGVVPDYFGDSFFG